jgi:hypothetical protein
MGCPDTQNTDSTKTQHTLQSHVHECRGRCVWPTRHASIADVSVMDLIDETRRIAITSQPMNTGVFTLAIARRLGVSVFLPQAICAAYDAPMNSRGDHALSFCSSRPVSRATCTAPSCLLSVAPHAIQTCAASVRSVDCFRTHKGGPTTTVQLISMLHHLTHVKALELTGWRRRLMSLLCRALRRRGSVANPCLRPRGPPDMRLLSLRAARHPPFSTERRTYSSCSG